MDIVFSKLVRLRDRQQCQSCARTDRKLDCAHIESRRHSATRWDPDNAMCLCFACHQWYGEHPYEWCEFVTDRMGEQAYADIRQKARAVKKWKKGEKEALYQDLKAQLKALEEERREDVDIV
jgi:hypothetical protein